jgi:hypothetical protein
MLNTQTLKTTCFAKFMLWLKNSLKNILRDEREKWIKSFDFYQTKNQYELNIFLKNMFMFSKYVFWCITWILIAFNTHTYDSLIIFSTFKIKNTIFLLRIFFKKFLKMFFKNISRRKHFACLTLIKNLKN